MRTLTTTARVIGLGAAPQFPLSLPLLIYLFSTYVSLERLLNNCIRGKTSKLKENNAAALSVICEVGKWSIHPAEQQLKHQQDIVCESQLIETVDDEVLVLHSQYIRTIADLYFPCSYGTVFVFVCVWVDDHRGDCSNADWFISHTHKQLEMHNTFV